MAVVNQLSTNAAPLAHPATASEVSGQKTKKITKVVTTTATDSNASIYLLGRVPGQAIVTKIAIHTADIASMNDCDIGLYDMNGTVKVVDCFAEALDLSGHGGLSITRYASAYEHPAMVNVATTDADDPVWDLAADVEDAWPAVAGTHVAANYQIGLIANAGPTAAVSFVVEIEYLSAAG